MGKLVEGTRSEGAKVGGFWRINFSRVEWTVVQVADQRLARQGPFLSLRLGMHTGKIQPTQQKTIGCGVLRGRFRCISLRGVPTFGNGHMIKAGREYHV